MTDFALEPSSDGLEALSADELAQEVRSRRLPFARPFAVLLALPRLLTWAGVLTSAVGLVLLAIAWGRTAALTNVGLQTPYVVSAGFTGLGLVLVGLALVSLDAKRADSAERRRQLRELRDVLAELRQALEERA